METKKITLTIDQAELTIATLYFLQKLAISFKAINTHPVLVVILRMTPNTLSSLQE